MEFKAKYQFCLCKEDMEKCCEKKAAEEYEVISFSESCRGVNGVVCSKTLGDGKVDEFIFEYCFLIEGEKSATTRVQYFSAVSLLLQVHDCIGKGHHVRQADKPLTLRMGFVCYDCGKQFVIDIEKMKSQGILPVETPISAEQDAKENKYREDMMKSFVNEVAEDKSKSGGDKV